MIGTSDRLCWLAETCKTPPLEGLWIHGLTVLTIVLTVAEMRDKVASRLHGILDPFPGSRFTYRNSNP